MIKLRKSKKGGIASEEVVGVVSVIFIALIVGVALFTINFLQGLKKQQQVEASVEEISANHNLFYFTKSNYEALSKKNYPQLTVASNNFFGGIYSGASYDLTIGGTSLNSVRFTQKIAEATINTPLITKEVLEIRLIVGTSDQHLRQAPLK